MNNVMDYRGYRFFQSSYDLDDPTTPENEEGTRLSVNSDWWGTNITYVGYLLMAIGMLFSLFSPYSRFKELNAKLKKTRERREALNTLLLILVLSFSGATVAQEHHDSDGHEHHHDGHEHHHEPVKKAVFRVMSEEHAEHFESLMVQDFDGRIIPMHTSCDQLLRKMYRGNKFKKWNAVQTIMSMHMYPQHWMKVPVVQVAANLRDTLKLKEFASFKDLADEQGEFRWMKEYNEAHHKLEAKRNEFDKKLLKLLDKFQVAKSIFSWRYMKWIPSKGDKNNTWFVPLSMDLMKMDSTSSNFALRYLKKLDDACKSNQFGEVDDLLSEWKAFQIKEGAGVIPSESKIKVEISYNKMNIFKNTWHTYMGVGFLLLILFFVRIFVKTSGIIEKSFKVMSKVFVGLLVIMFLYHGMGLGFRWYITGYAPWSNGYGAIVFIAWVTMIAGFLFSRKNPVIIAGTAILAALMIFVSEMNLMDPEITPIQPVLKSYWLMIHVSIITGSYGFLGLGCILSLLCLILYIARTERNGKVITLHITELSYVTEMIITVGLFMLTIGTFLGGIWANESWGRYWAWDPKEVWALVSVLVYAIILHLRYIPGLASKFTFNVVTFWAYSAILFTFFGVNFYLVGLHSYAQGDGLGSVPAGIIISAIVFMLLTIWAGYRNKIYTQSFQAKTWGRIVFDFLLIRTVLVYALSLITVDSHPFWPTTFYWLAIFNGALFVFHVVFKRITKEANILKP
jgi:cytochrome c-type biogenesis protein CcsB